MQRSSGILLHPTSLPGRYGIGDLGPEARHFIDFLADAGQGLWQVLPIGPTGYGDSPYQSPSAFAGNILLLSPDLMVEEGWLTPDQLTDVPDFSVDRVDYEAVSIWKRRLLDQAYERFRTQALPAQRDQFTAFCRTQVSWLEDYSLFAAVKEHHGGALWTTWEPALAAREPSAMYRWREKLAHQVAVQQFGQFVFFHQWMSLRQYAHLQGVRLVGDMPIFVAHDSAEVWAHPEWFYLDDAGNPTLVAGVPPDYFSATGQRWGNPLYRWDVLAADGYKFWIDRLRHMLTVVDWIRLDHFRGFAAYWEIAASHPTAEHGRWVPGPGTALFDVVRESLGKLPLIAEDLGVITPDVEALKDYCDLPGMAILQFGMAVALHDETSPDLAFQPHNHRRDLVVYTGTHDNDTTLGWWRLMPSEQQNFALRYLNSDGREIHWDFIRTALASVGDWAIFPLQDLLGLGTEARLNLPGRPHGNWDWRYRADVLTPELAERLKALSVLYRRKPAPPDLLRS